MVYMYHSFLIHSSADGHLGCFHVLAMINSAAMNIGVHVSLSDLVSLVCMPRSGIAWSYGSSISDGEHMWTHGWFISMYDKSHYNKKKKIWKKKPRLPSMCHPTSLLCFLHGTYHLLVYHVPFIFIGFLFVSLHYNIRCLRAGPFGYFGHWCKSSFRTIPNIE